MPTGATPPPLAPGAVLTAQVAISNELITFTSLQVSLLAAGGVSEVLLRWRGSPCMPACFVYGLLGCMSLHSFHQCEC